MKQTTLKLKAMETYKSTIGEYEVSLPEEYYGNKVVGTLWEKNGKSRVYVKVYYETSRTTDCGYVDLVAGKSCLSSRPVMVARIIESETEIRKMEEVIVEEEIINNTEEVKSSQEADRITSDELKKDLYTNHSLQSAIIKELGLESKYLLTPDKSEERLRKILNLSRVEYFALADGGECYFLIVNNKPMGGFGNFCNGNPIEVKQFNPQSVYDAFANSEVIKEHKSI